MLFLFSPVALSVSLLAIPLSQSPYSYFVPPETDPTDFSSWGSLAQAGGALGMGGSKHTLNFYSVNHSPNPIFTDGVDIGLGISVGIWVPGRYKLLDSVKVSTAGSAAALTIGALDDSDDLANAIASASAEYMSNNTDPAWA